MSRLTQVWHPVWCKRDVPLSPLAGWFKADLLDALRLRLMSYSKKRLEQLRCVVTQEGVLVIGEGQALPWLDGAVWLGVDDVARELLQPTLWQTDVPAVLLQQACLKKVGCAAALVYPCANAATLVVPIEVARPLISWLYPDGMVEVDKTIENCEDITQDNLPGKLDVLKQEDVPQALHSNMPGQENSQPSTEVKVLKHD